GDHEGDFLGWVSPVKELVHPRHVNLEARGGLGWLDGVSEWMVRCGLSSFGAPSADVIRDNTGREKEVLLTIHGRIANVPASVVRAKIGLNAPFEFGVEGIVYERSMFGPNLKLTTSITTIPDGNSLKISDTVQNLRTVPDEMQMLYHCNYGSPFLEEGVRLEAPFRRVAPINQVAMQGVDSFDIVGPPQSGFIEQVYFMELLADNIGRTKAALVSKDETRAVSVSFSVRELPCFTLWKNTAAFEEGYVVGLEPATSFPNAKRFERGRNRVVKLGPGEAYRSGITLSVHLGKDEVSRLTEEIDRIRGKTKPIVFKEPIRDFSPV
ncbi:MAG: aldose 1-epimerase family protein, partial [Candidatus Bathyarchaeota archaeon]|nr:aldose 1-epimerase family protein [Candidatus Bathyarchaeota archaeon]